MLFLSDSVASALDYLKETAGLGEPVPEVGVSGIRPGMEVISACGQRVGVVDNLDGMTLQLTLQDSPDGVRHFLPVGWVLRVDQQVHITRSRAAVWQSWQG